MNISNSIIFANACLQVQYLAFKKCKHLYIQYPIHCFLTETQANRVMSCYLIVKNPIDMLVSTHTYANGCANGEKRYQSDTDNMWYGIVVFAVLSVYPGQSKSSAFKFYCRHLENSVQFCEQQYEAKLAKLPISRSIGIEILTRIFYENIIILLELELTYVSGTI